ncbi:unnamed protein product [Chrysoparadoxa australica]
MPTHSQARQRQMHAVLALLEGTFEGLCMGGKAPCLAGDADSTALEECVILAEGWPAAHKPTVAEPASISLTWY